ncbi:MAG: hypothetical protein HGA59_10595 [Chlorobiaceae bacterium]|nr:hypothetical protein [Chlorobiaceae bacterium]
MDIKNWTGKTSKGFYSITEVAAWIGYITTAGIVLIVLVDVCGRYLLNKPLIGSYELVGGKTSSLLLIRDESAFWQKSRCLVIVVE